MQELKDAIARGKGAADATLFDASMREVEQLLKLDLWPRYLDEVISGTSRWQRPATWKQGNKRET